MLKEWLSHNCKFASSKDASGFSGDIEALSIENENFRKVIYTGKNSQLVLMSLKPNEEIGMETHPANDQFFRIEKGLARLVINGEEQEVDHGSAMFVPAGAKHNIINMSSKDPLKLYTIYSPPHHKDGTVHVTKKDAEDSDEEFDGETTEPV